MTEAKANAIILICAWILVFCIIIIEEKRIEQSFNNGIIEGKTAEKNAANNILDGFVVGYVCKKNKDGSLCDCMTENEAWEIRREIDKANERYPYYPYCEDGICYGRIAYIGKGCK